MDSKTFFTLVLATYITLVSLEAVTGRSHGLKYNHHHYHLHNSYHNRNHPNPTSLDNSGENKERNAVSHKHHHDKSAPWRPSSSSMDDYEDDDDDGDDGRHAYLMTKNKGNKKSSASSEDQTLTSVFEKHIQGATNIHHDVYAYQLPSDLWFIVRYSKNEDGQMEKYMNVVDSFTNYLEKLDSEVRTVSVNVKGVETVFRLTPKAPKRKADDN